jgi:hypothetical protein
MLVSDAGKLPPFERLVYWVTEREQIRMKKKMGLPKPWTDDRILQSRKFCNVVRADDKVSSWLIKNWYTPYKDHPNILLAATLARHLNRVDSLEAVGFPHVWEPTRLTDLLEERSRHGLKNFSAAYLITGNHGCRDREKQTKVYQVINIVCDTMYRMAPDITPFSMRSTWMDLQGFPGVSKFIASQIVADLRWAVTGEWADRWTWFPVGPGSVKGLNRLYERDMRYKVSGRQFQVEMKEVKERLSRRLNKHLVARMEAIDFQNCMCEYDKWERTRLHEGRTRGLYDGKGDEW